MQLCRLVGLGMLAASALWAREALSVEQTRSPIVVAHRGWLNPTEPENDLMVMKKTNATGGYMVEMDLSAGRDGTLYLLHDPTVDRTTSGTGALRSMSDQEISLLRLKDGHGNLTDDHIPRFDAVLAWAQATPGATLMLDIKKADPPTVAAGVRAAGLIDRVIVLTFDPQTAEAAIAADANWRVSVLVKTTEELTALSARSGTNRLAAYLPTFAAPDLFRQAHSSGLETITDGVVPMTDGGLDERFEKNGVGVYQDYFASRPIDVLVTNHPASIPRSETAAR